MKVLVVEDTELMRKILCEHVRRFGATEVIQAVNGIRAIEVLQDKPIDIIISGLNMPKMNGLELLVKVRQSPEISNIPFLMVTSEASRESIKEIIKAGVSELLIKPFTAATIRAKVSNLRNASYEANTLPRFDKSNTEMVLPDTLPIHAEHIDELKILVVDDTPENLMLTTGVLKNDYQILIAKNGGRALEICNSNSPPELVLLDIMMPDMDGFEVLERLRTQPLTSHIPVMFVTALSQNEDEIKGLACGAVDYIKKPVQPEILRLRVKALLDGIHKRNKLQSEYDQMLAEAKLQQRTKRILFDEIRRPLESSTKLIQNLKADRRTTALLKEKLDIVQALINQTTLIVEQAKSIELIESGRFVLESKVFSAHAMIESPLQIMQEIYKQKNILVYSEPDEDLDNQFLVTGDQSLTQIIIFNILKNAFLAAPIRSRIIITLRPAKDGCLLSIENSGVVPHELRETFWEKYATLNPKTNLGLGTYCIKLLAEVQKGQVDFSVDDDKDTTAITVLLPR